MLLARVGMDSGEVTQVRETKTCPRKRGTWHPVEWATRGLPARAHVGGELQRNGLLGLRAHQPIDERAVSENEQRRDAFDAVAGGGGWVLIDVELDDAI